MDRRDPMTTDRRFSRFSKSPDTAAFSTTEIPEGGVCLSAFLIVAQAGQPSRILMGHMNPEAPWDHIGALDPKRVEVHSRGWMLPSSHLIFLESPEDAARRIARDWMAPSSHLIDLQSPDAPARRDAREKPDLPQLILSGHQVV